MRYELELVETFPNPILPGRFYYSAEFKTSRHICACGCGDVIKLPIDALHHKLTVGRKGPTVRPSIGNWHVCDAHYFITEGEVEWAPKMSQEAIAAGRRFEDERRELHFKAQDTFWRRAKRKIANAFKAVTRIFRKG